jgi:NAD(P)H-dependent FMN reductase
MKVQIIIGSTREGRVTDRAAKWVVNHAREKLDGYEVELLDLRDYEMPFFNESVSPQFNPERKPEPIVKKWLDKLAEADAYILVTPEYSRSYPAVLKNALDFTDYQLEKKPVALVAHGSTGGSNAVAHLRGVLPGVLAITIPAATYFSDGVAGKIDDNGVLDEEVKNRAYGPQTSLENLLAQLKWYSDALAAARANK